MSKKCKMIDCNNLYYSKEMCKQHYRQHYWVNNERHRVSVSEDVKNYKRNWYLKNKKRLRELAKLAPSAQKEYRNAYWRNSRKININSRLGRILRNRLWNALKGFAKNGSAVRDLGCTIPELKLYLESKFQPGMTWDNYGMKGWHIDHIRPLSSFDLSDKDQFSKAFNYSNLQPLWAEDNLSKGSKIG